MLCPWCGTEVGERMSLCDACQAMRNAQQGEGEPVGRRPRMSYPGQEELPTAPRSSGLFTEPLPTNAFQRILDNEALALTLLAIVGVTGSFAYGFVNAPGGELSDRFLHALLLTVLVGRWVLLVSAQLFCFFGLIMTDVTLAFIYLLIPLSIPKLYFTGYKDEMKVPFTMWCISMVLFVISMFLLPGRMVDTTMTYWSEDEVRVERLR